MVKIRKGCFETNSSSTHALCLDTTNKYPKYTREHLEAFTDVVYPFSEEEAHEIGEKAEALMRKTKYYEPRVAVRAVLEGKDTI